MLLSLVVPDDLENISTFPLQRISPAAVAALCVADFALAHRDRLLELDVNPLLVLPAGQGVVAADALIRMAGPVDGPGDQNTQS